jgi:NAD(P)-dependent dehydrogenase (short-subunit alcohol dehydrogenase family)
MSEEHDGSADGAVLIVGAGPRLGAAIARRLGAGGRPVGLIARSRGPVEELAETLTAEGVSAFGEAADVADAADLAGAIDRLARLTSPFAVAVHNISAWRDAGAGVLTADDLLADVAAGAASLVTIVNAVLPAMLARRNGTILATGSGAADHPTPGAPSLAVQKAALRILTRGFAAELAPRGVHCATVTVTGTLDTPGFAVGDIAGVYADLVAETSRPREQWRTVVEFGGTR